MDIAENVEENNDNCSKIYLFALLVPIFLSAICPKSELNKMTLREAANQQAGI